MRRRSKCCSFYSDVFQTGQVTLSDAIDSFSRKQLEGFARMILKRHWRSSKSFISSHRLMAVCEMVWGATIEALVERAVAKEQLREARYYIARLRKSDPEHPTAKEAVRPVCGSSHRTAETCTGSPVRRPARRRFRSHHAGYASLALPPVNQKYLSNNRNSVSDRQHGRFPFSWRQNVILSTGQRRIDDVKRCWATRLFEVRKIDRAAILRVAILRRMGLPRISGGKSSFSLRPRRSSWGIQPDADRSRCGQSHSGIGSTRTRRITMSGLRHSSIRCR